MLDGQRKYSEKTKYIEKLSMCAWNYLMKWQDEKGDRKEIFKKKTDCRLWNSITELLLIDFFARLQNFTRFYVGKYFSPFYCVHASSVLARKEIVTRGGCLLNLFHLIFYMYPICLLKHFIKQTVSHLRLLFVGPYYRRKS